MPERKRAFLYDAFPNTTCSKSVCWCNLRVIFRLFPGSGAPLENLNFDGVDIGLGSGSQLSPAKPLKVVIHGWGMSTLNNGQVQPADDMALKYVNTYEDAGMD